MDLSDSKEADIISGENCGRNSRYCIKWMSNLLVQKTLQLSEDTLTY